MPTADDYAGLVDSYENGVNTLEDIVKDAREIVSELVITYDFIWEKLETYLQGTTDSRHHAAYQEWYRNLKRKLARSERSYKSEFDKILRAHDEAFGELLAAIDYVENYLPGLSQQRRMRLSAKYDNLRREASELLERKIAT